MRRPRSSRAPLRISTNSRIWANPLDSKTAFAVISEWLEQPGVIALQPGPKHAEILARLVEQHRAAGPLVTDVASTDQDFRRFVGLRWVNPLPQ